MGRTIKFTEDFGRVKAKNKKLVGGFKKGDVWENCSATLAQKLVNRKKVAVYVDQEPGDADRKAGATALKIVADAKKEAAEIIEAAKKEAAEIIEAAKKEAAEANKDLI